MITQTLKNWFRALFAWWPWKQSTVVNHTPLVSRARYNSTQESQWPAAVNTTEQANPQSEGTSIAVEQVRMDDLPSLPLTSTDKKEQTTPAPSQHEDETIPSTEQHLEFLRYLVTHDIFNEGFSKGHEPEQYKKK
jgi:hypothetical protein